MDRRIFNMKIKFFSLYFWDLIFEKIVYFFLVICNETHIDIFFYTNEEFILKEEDNKKVQLRVEGLTQKYISKWYISLTVIHFKIRKRQCF